MTLSINDTQHKLHSASGVILLSVEVPLSAFIYNTQRLNFFLKISSQTRQLIAGNGERFIALAWTKKRQV
jgi:hypothetical protein